MKQLYIYITLFLLLFTSTSRANGFSYVYIQGDKQTPFYVKFEDEMLPRYGKNYCIISQLAPGPIKIQILFQQNIYPPQSFTIQVPENGFRGFLLTRKNESFSLYDIQEQFYLQAGNTAEDDRITEVVSKAQPLPVNPEPVVNNIAQLKAVEQDVSEKTANSLPDKVDTEPGITTQTLNKTSKEVTGPEFMDIELSRATVSNNETKDNSFKGNVAIPNSDCPKAVDIELFEAIQKKANDKSDKNRLKYLLEKTESNCFTTNQARILTRTLKNDPERYTFLKKIYSRITDQAKFPTLEALLTTQEWKSYFRLIIP